MTIHHFRGENGAELYYDGPVLPESIAHRLARGTLTRIHPDEEPAEPVPGSDEPDTPQLPSVRDNRAAWTEYAITQGMEQAEVDAMTKAQLITRFTTDPESEPE